MTFTTRRWSLVLALAGTAWGGCATSRGAAANGAPTDQVAVRVIDEAGAPLGGVEVTGRYQTNPGPTGSTCCREVVLGPVTTARDGLAQLPRPAATMTPVVITARRGDWPAQAVALPTFGAPNAITLTLGPPRAIEGQVTVPDDCPGGLLEVAASAPPVTAQATPDGHFVLPGMGPGPVTVGVSACGRSVTAAADGGAHRQVTLALPPSPKAGRYRAPAIGQAHPPAAKLAETGTAPGPAASRCALGDSQPLIAGDFDRAAIDPGCRYALARQHATTTTGTHPWQLARPGAAPLQLGGLGTEPPLVGRRVVVGEVVGDATAFEAVDLTSGARRLLGHASRVALGTGDVIVLYGAPASGGGPAPTGPLELVSPDGRRRSLTPRAAADWSLLEDGSRLLYRRAAGGTQPSEAHVYDLAAGHDRTIATPADRVWSFAGAREVVVAEGDRLFAMSADGTHRQSAAEPAATWQVLGPDLFVSQGARGAVTVRTGGRDLVVPFAWAQQRPRLHLVGARYLLLESGGDLVVGDGATGEARLLAEGARLSPDAAPPAAGDRIAVQELTGRTLVLSLSGTEHGRAVARGTPRSFSPDGRWLAVEAASPAPRIDLVSVEGPVRSVAVAARGGQWAQAQPPIYLGSAGDGASPAPPLVAVAPDQDSRRQLEARALSFTPLPDGDLLVVLPPGSAERPGVWRRPLAPPSRP